MVNKRHSIIIVFFFIISIVILYYSISFVKDHTQVSSADSKLEGESSYFKGLSYYSTSAGRNEFKLKGSELIIRPNSDLVFKEPKGMILKDGKTILYSANKGKFDESEKNLFLNGKVFFSTEGEFTHRSNRVNFDLEKNYFDAVGSTVTDIRDTKSSDRIIIKSGEMKSWFNQKRMIFNANVSAELQRKRNYEGKLSLKASSMSFNQLKSHISMTGGVSLKRNKYYLHANKADLFLENFNKRLKYYTLYDDIKLEEKLVLADGTQVTRRAFSEKLEGYMKDNKIILSGAPRVEQDGDLIKGYLITLRENVELVEVDDSQTRFNIERGDKE